MHGRAPGKPVRRFLFGTVLSTAALVGWGMIFWVYLAQPLGVFRVLPDAVPVTEAFKSRELATGTYFVPWPRDTAESRRAFREHHRSGSFYQLAYVRGGVDPQSPGQLSLGVLHDAAVALLAGLLVWLLRDKSYAWRALTVFVAGLMGTSFISLADPMWFHLPWDYTLGTLVYQGVAWLLLALLASGTAVGRPTAARAGLIMNL